MSKGIVRAAVSPISLVIGKKATRSLLQVVGVVASFIPGGQLVAAAAFLASATVFKATPKTPGVSLSALDRLQASLNPSAPRTMVFGRTAMATDIRYVEPSGTNQEYIDYIIAVASHRVGAIEQLWFEDALAWSSSGGVQGVYVGFLDVTPILEGSAGAYHTVNGGTRWGSSQRLTGCASIHLRIKRSGTTSPFTGGLPGRTTVIGKGLPLYDPRRDSTVPGGSGTMRANDQTTWAYAPSGTEIGQNIALQSLAYLLGWKINGKLAVGCGIPAARLDLAGFITAANLCDETVTTSTGSQPRYHGAGLVSENDDPGQALSMFATGCNGRFRESLGKLALIVMHNDLALAAADPGLGDDEMIGGFTWNPDPSLEQTYNVVRGRFTDPSNASLFQLVDYPEVRLTSTDGIDRVLQLDLPWVQDAAMAQRIAKQTLERKQYQRSLSAVWNMAGWGYKVGDIVPVTLSPLGFSRRLFRVEQQVAGFDGTCPMILTEENDAIYAWDADDRAPVTPASPISYNPLNDPILQLILAAGIGQVAEGSVDGVTGWHYPPTAGDLYLRYSTDGGVTWGPAIQIVGEGGPGEHEVSIFKRNATQPSTPTGDGIPAGWSDGIPGGDPAVPVWESLADQIDGITQGVWTTPGQISGPAGQSPLVGLLTNESATVSASSTGTVSSFAGMGGTFRVFLGLIEVTGSATFSVVSQTNVTMSGPNSSGVYAPTAMSADTGYATLRATYSGVTVDKVYSIAKSKTGLTGGAGDPGADAKILVVISDRQTIAYDGTGALSPTTQTTTFTAQKQNTTATVTWSMTDLAGGALSASTYLSSTTGDSVTMSAASFNAARGASGGVIVTGTLVDGSTLTDKISVVRVAAGATGAAGLGTTSLSVLGPVTFDGSTIDSPTDGGGSFTNEGAWSNQTVAGGASVSFQVPLTYGTSTDFFIGLRSAPSSSFTYSSGDLGAFRFADYNTGVASGDHFECWTPSGSIFNGTRQNGYTYQVRYDAVSGISKFLQISTSGTATTLASFTPGAGKGAGIFFTSGKKGRVTSLAFGAAGADGAGGGGGGNPGAVVSGSPGATSVPNAIVMQPGQTRTLSYSVTYSRSGGGTSAFVSAVLQWSLDNGSWNNISGSSQGPLTVNASTDATLEGGGTFTNGGTAQLVYFRLLTTVSGAATVIVLGGGNFVG